jgi:hypothetical protein
VADAGTSQPSRLFKAIGWLIGLIYAVGFPKLIAPMSLSMWFDVDGALSGALGFSGMFWLLSKRNVSGRRKLFTALGALAAGIVASGVYTSLLLSVENVTPGTWIRISELALYCIACFCFAVVVSYVYWYGGPKVIKMFNKNAAASGG